MENKWAAIEIKGATETLRVIISKLSSREGYISQQYPISKNIQHIQESIKKRPPLAPMVISRPHTKFF